jgi:ribonucleoside-diphosphate reductase alpha chain
MGHLSDEDCPVWVAEFPVKAPVGSMFRNAETAIEMCERYLQVMRSWCGDRGHNQSATIYVRDYEWFDVGQWVYDHFDEITGLSFLPYDGGSYQLAPYEELTEAEYIARMDMMPDVDFSLLSVYEWEDRGQGAVELACTSGKCEI